MELGGSFQMTSLAVRRGLNKKWGTQEYFFFLTWPLAWKCNQLLCFACLITTERVELLSINETLLPQNQVWLHVTYSPAWKGRLLGQMLSSRCLEIPNDFWTRHLGFHFSLSLANYVCSPPQNLWCPPVHLTEMPSVQWTDPQELKECCFSRFPCFGFC